MDNVRAPMQQRRRALALCSGTSPRAFEGRRRADGRRHGAARVSAEDPPRVRPAACAAMPVACSLASRASHGARSVLRVCAYAYVEHFRLRLVSAHAVAARVSLDPCALSVVHWSWHACAWHACVRPTQCRGRTAASFPSGRRSPPCCPLHSAPSSSTPTPSRARARSRSRSHTHAHSHARTRANTHTHRQARRARTHRCDESELAPLDGLPLAAEADEVRTRAQQQQCYSAVYTAAAPRALTPMELKPPQLPDRRERPTQSPAAAPPSRRVAV
jgi:hypothetical protein